MANLLLSKTLHATTLLLCSAGLLATGCSSESATDHERADAAKREWKQVVVERKPGQIVVKGKGVVHVDPDTGWLCWPALTCTLDDCSGKSVAGEPVVFSERLAGTRVTASGTIEWGPRVRPIGDAVKCPVCKREAGVRPYEAPEVKNRRAELSDELARSRAARKQARQSGQAPPDNLRTPQDILDEMADLPIVYLLDNPSRD